MGPSERRAMAYLIQASEGTSLAGCRDALALGWLEGLALIDADHAITERGRTLARLTMDFAEFCLWKGVLTSC